MSIFVVKFCEKEQERILQFATIEELFTWLQEYWDDYTTLPEKMVVFKAFCLFDAT